LNTRIHRTLCEMSIRSSPLMSVFRATLAHTQAGPSRRLLSTTTTIENRPTPVQSLGSIFDDAWGPNSPLGTAALGSLQKQDVKDIKDDLRAAGVSPSIANFPTAQKGREVDSTTGRPLFKPGYEAGLRPPRVDPLLDLFTNLIMKHGRKAEAQKRLSEVLDIMYVPSLISCPILSAAHLPDDCCVYLFYLAARLPSPTPSLSCTKPST